MKLYFQRLRNSVVLGMASILMLAILLVSPSSQAFARSQHTYSSHVTVQLGLFIADPKTQHPLHPQSAHYAISPDGTQTLTGDCGSTTIKADTGVGRNIIVTASAASSQGWILSGSWHVTVNNAGARGGSFGNQWGPNWSTGYTQSTPLAQTVYGVIFDSFVADTFLAGTCVGLNPRTTAKSGG